MTKRNKSMLDSQRNKAPGLRGRAGAALGNPSPTASSTVYSFLDTNYVFRVSYQRRNGAKYAAELLDHWLDAERYLMSGKFPHA
jgi:hypothetical protein